MMPWGVEELNLIQRYKLAIEAGVNLFSGTADPYKLIETLNNHLELMPLVDESVHRLLLEKFRLGLFENPYVDVNEAEKIVGKKEFQDKANIALRKSIVLLRNGSTDKASLPLKAKTKVYFESHQISQGKPLNNVFTPDTNNWEVEFVDTAEEADIVLLWLIPKSK